MVSTSPFLIESAFAARYVRVKRTFSTKLSWAHAGILTMSKLVPHLEARSEVLVALSA